MHAGGIRFQRVRAHRFRAEGHCTAWHIEGAYDTLVEVEQSGWIAELLAAEPSETWGALDDPTLPDRHRRCGRLRGGG